MIFLLFVVINAIAIPVFTVIILKRDINHLFRKIIFSFMLISAITIISGTQLVSFINIPIHLIIALLEVLLVYIIFATNKKDYQTMFAVSLAEVTAYLLLLVIDLFINVIDDLMLIAILICIYIIVGFLLKKITIKDNYGINAIFLIYIYIVLLILSYINDLPLKEQNTLIIPVGVSQLIFSVFLLRVVYRIQEQKISKREEENLKIYTKNLEEAQASLRKFKHDYKNLLMGITQKDIDEKSIQELISYSYSKLDNQAFWKYNNLDKITNRTIKSIIIGKLNTMYSFEIPYTFECPDEIDQISGLETFDLIRMIGIIFDNAIEASRERIKSGKKAEIRAIIYKDGDNLGFEVRNRCNDNINLEEVMKREYTTKDNHEGLGLSIINDMTKKYANIDLNYNVDNGWFNILLVIEGGCDRT